MLMKGRINIGLTDNFIRQHNKIYQIANEILSLLDEYNSKNISQIRRLISTLAGKLKIHLSMEDKSLYPRLLKNEDDIIRTLSKKYIMAKYKLHPN